jgi:hypothetical protein
VKNYKVAADKVRSKVEFIDSEKAANWLTRNTRNRAFKWRVVKRIADSIRGGEWALNGESIIWASDNVLVDGQNRLQAIVETNVPSPGLPCVVVYGVSPDVFNTVDGGAPRSAKDDLSVLGYSYTARNAAAAALLYMYRNFGTMLPARRPTRTQVLEMLQTEPSLSEAIKPAETIHRQLPNVFATHTVVLYHLFDEVDSDANELFWKYLVEGSNLEKDSPILLLRNRIISTFTGSASRNAYASAEFAALTIKAFNAFLAGQKIGSLRWKGTGRFAEDFPVVQAATRTARSARAAA